MKALKVIAILQPKYILIAKEKDSKYPQHNELFFTRYDELQEAGAKLTREGWKCHVYVLEDSE